jgi:hypothetical protein
LYWSRSPDSNAATTMRSWSASALCASVSMRWPARSRALRPVRSQRARLTRTTQPSPSAIAIPIGDPSKAPRKSSSAVRRSVSSRLRVVMSRIALETIMPSSVSIGLRLISMGNSLPSLRSP